jgi:hypothetical protein
MLRYDPQGYRSFGGAMLGPYQLLIVLFTLAGGITTAWGWLIIRRARRSSRWPRVRGVIEVLADAPHNPEDMPEIRVRYVVGGHTHFHTVEPPDDMIPTPEFAAQHLAKYPNGGDVDVYYDPAAPHSASLARGLLRGDWMVFAAGALATVFGVSLLLFAG